MNEKSNAIHQLRTTFTQPQKKSTQRIETTFNITPTKPIYKENKESYNPNPHEIDEMSFDDIIDDQEDSPEKSSPQKITPKRLFSEVNDTVVSPTKAVRTKLDQSPSTPKQSITTTLTQNFFPIFQKTPQNSPFAISPVFSQETSQIIALLKQRKYKFYTPDDIYADNPVNCEPCLSEEGTIHFISESYNSYINSKIRVKELPEKNSVKLTYFCKNAHNNTHAIVSRKLGSTENSIQKQLGTWTEWHNEHFLKNAGNSNIQCLFIFEFTVENTANTEQEVLKKIGKILCESDIKFPCDFMFSYGNNLSATYSPESAKIAYQNRPGTLNANTWASNSSNLTPIESSTDEDFLLSIATSYETMIKNADDYYRKNNFSQSLKNTDIKSYKENFSPAQFIKQFVELNNHYRDLSNQLILLKNHLISYKTDAANELREKIQDHTAKIQEYRKKLELIREEYVGNKTKEEALKKQWETIQQNKQAMKTIATKISTQLPENPTNVELWLTEKNNMFTVLSHMHDTKISSLFIIPYCQELGSKLAKDFSSHPSNSLTNINNFTNVL